jgi:hypothetical protein
MGSNFTFQGYIYITDTATCTSHSWNNRGFCTRCNVEFSITLENTTTWRIFRVSVDSAPIRNRPYSPDTIIRNLARNTEVTVVGEGRNSQGNLWYRLSDGTWVFSGNVTLVRNVTYTVTFNSQGGTAVANRTVNHGTAVGLLPTPTRTGHTLLGWWTEASGGEQISQNRIITSNRTFHARWQVITYTVTVKAGTGGTASGSGTVNHGLSHTVTATPNSGFEFEGWYDGNTRVSTNRSYSFIVGSNRTLQARFTPIPPPPTQPPTAPPTQPPTAPPTQPPTTAPPSNNYCGNCGFVISGNFCSNCGSPPTTTAPPMCCGSVVSGNFCSHCGKPNTPPAICNSICTHCNGNNRAKGRILGTTAEPTIFDALEIVKSIVGMDNIISKCGNARSAALIVPTRPTPNVPTIFDALEIVKHVVGMIVL